MQTPRARRSIGRPCKGEESVRANELLDIAARLFIEKGYRATTVSAIAEAVGASKKTIYQKYTDKAGLFAAVFHHMAKDLPLLQEDFTEFDRLSLEESLVLQGKRLLEMAYSPPIAAMSRLLIREGPAFPELNVIWTQVAERVNTRPLVRFFSHLIARGKIAGGDPRLLASIFTDLLSGETVARIIHQDQTVPSERKREKFVRMRCAVFTRGIGALAS